MTNRSTCSTCGRPLATLDDHSDPVLNPDDGDGSQLLCWREDYVGDKCQGGPVAVTRDQRQAAVFAWAQQAFTEEQATSLPQRGLRLLEEAIEAAQAAGCSRVMAHALVDFVFDRPPGELSQELGGVGVTVLLLAAAAGLSADEAERVEVERVLSKPLSWFAERNEAKNAAGFLAVKTGVE